MKVLNGSELASYIKQRQVHQVRGLRQAHDVSPKLAIIVTINNPVIETYMKLKKRYGADLLIDVDIHRIKQTDARALLNKLNNDDSVNGIIVQLPLEDPSETDVIVNLVAPEKDVDALGKHAKFDPATPMAIMWLISGYNIDLQGKRVLLIGRGKLVGAPLEKMLQTSGIDVHVAERETANLTQEALEADVIITATGSPAILSADMVKQGAVVVDAGVASEEGKTVGDVARDVYERDDLTITPKKGGVGPLTVCALFENVIRAAQRVADKTKDMKIGVFDSGVGGLSVANAIKKALPETEVLLCDDKQHIPYGTRQPSEVLDFVTPIFQTMVDDGCDVIVVACNTVSTNLITELRQQFNKLPLIAVEPMVKLAAKLTRSGVITVCATPATLASQRYKRLKKRYAKNVTVLEPDCHDWSYMIEHEQVNEKKIRLSIEKTLDQDADVIVLGCTHYHWIEQEIKDIAEGRAQVLQPEPIIVGQLRQLIKQLS